MFFLTAQSSWQCSHRRVKQVRKNYRFLMYINIFCSPQNRPPFKMQGQNCTNSHRWAQMFSSLQPPAPLHHSHHAQVNVRDELIPAPETTDQKDTNTSSGIWWLQREKGLKKIQTTKSGLQPSQIKEGFYPEMSRRCFVKGTFPRRHIDECSLMSRCVKGILTSP